MNSPEWDDEEPTIFDGDEPIFIDDDDYEGEIGSLDDLKKEIFQDKVIHSFVTEAFQFNGREAINEILNSIERKMGWKLEIVATQGRIEDEILKNINSFDEDGWINYIMSDEYQKMTYRANYISEFAVDEFISAYYGSLTMGQRFRRYIKNKAWSFFQYL